MANPYVSVVVCTMGMPWDVLEGLKNQTFKDFQVILAREKGIVPAMTAALLKARGEIFVRVDDDVEIPPTWLESLISPFSDPQVGGATGPTFVPKELRQNRDSIRWAENPHWFLRWLYDNAFNPGGIRKCGCVSYDSNFQEEFGNDGGVLDFNFEPDHLEGTNWAMRTELIRKVGGFDTKFDGVAEWFDTDVEFKIKKLGYRLLYSPKAYLYHLLGKGGHFNERFEGFGRIKNFLRFHWRHGRWRFLNIKFYVYVLVWLGYFIGKRFKWLK